ncbi:hypothetical protein OG365_07205 [Streptomyces sp. NBC_00853]|uniref:hypothetical protein n=1 Tax=Streptomyces sp. NBC_00853 TaxID=2903681 RepID=UPI003872C2A9|nr:hypothetical protein OG365_07205 [Streptomyces sp. NBC_00853]
MADDPQNTPGNVPEGEHQGEPQNQPEGDQGKNGKPEGEPKNDDQGDELSAERAAREAAEREAARLRRSNAATKGTDLDAMREEIRAEFAAQLVRAEVRAAAAGRLRDPADALALVDLDALAGKNGEIDTKAVSAALDALIKAKPYLAAPDQSGPAPMWGDVGAGQRESAEPEPASPYERLRRVKRNS